MPVLNTADNIKLGSSQVDKVYLGATEVWAAGGGFSPSDIATLEAWYDASGIGLADGAAVNQWDDASGSGLHVTQTTASLQPTMKAASHINGKPAVRFDGTDDLLVNNAVAAFLSGAVDFTIYVVAHHLNRGLNKAAIAAGRSSNNTPIAFVGSSGTVAQHRALHRSNTNVAVNPTADLSLDIPAVASLTRTGTSVTLRVNGIDYPITGGGDMTVDRFALGALLRGTASSWVNADIAEALVFSSVLTTQERTDLEGYLNAKYGVGEVSAADHVVSLFDDGIAATPIVSASQITGALELREQDDIVHDPNDPNLGTNPEREYKLYFSANIDTSTNKRIFVVFSANGQTGWSAPVQCVMGASDRTSEDPSAATSLITRGEVHRSGGKMHVYVEDSVTSDVYGYESTDGINFTEMTGNPVIARVAATWEAELIGSPVARWDGSQYIVGYEGIDQPAPGATEAFGIASGATPNSLTKSANNPVWHPTPDPHASATIVVDCMFKNDAGDEFVLLAHAGGPAGTTSMFRGTTTNMDPTTWTSGDIETVAGDVDEVQGLKNDFTLDNSTGDMTQIVTTDATDQNVVRYKLSGVKRG